MSYSYTTKVRIDLPGLKSELPTLKAAFDELHDPTRETHEARSRFSRWNNLSKFVERLESGEVPSEPRADGSVVFSVEASAKGNSTRIYFHPSITSLTKEIRKHILPLNDNNIFVFFDVKAAEFALNCVYAQESEALAEYAKGGDIYMHFAPLFPAGTDRKVIKKILIANMYGQTAYRVALDLGITETQAQRILDAAAAALPLQTMLKRRISTYAMRNKAYFAPDGFDQTRLVKVADYNPKKGFDPNMAWSAYTQSGLGHIMQKFSDRLLAHQANTEGTFLSVFDSVLLEIDPSSAKRYEEWATTQLAPLLPEGFTYGKTFWEAAYGMSEE